MKITINRSGKPNQKLWNKGYSCRLVEKILGFYIIVYSKEKRIFYQNETRIGRDK